MSQQVSEIAAEAGYPFPAGQALRRFFLLCSDLIQLTKPRILVLLLISTCCPMVLAARGAVPLQLIALALLGGLFISASASVINCILDQDIDAIMERTKSRPLPAGRISSYGAGCWAFALGISGFLILCLGLNPLAGFIALFGHFFYVMIYTVWLKRSTAQNIVIGGAAGAIPPIVGWVGVTGTLSLDAILLFLVIFLWTPPHFWALALNKNEDYKRAKIPMMPVVRGEAETHRQMLWYAIALLPVTACLVAHNDLLGWFSGVILLGLGAVFVYKILQLCLLDPTESLAKTKKAWDVFGFSLIYLALFFVCLVVDSVLV